MENFKIEVAWEERHTATINIAADSKEDLKKMDLVQIAIDTVSSKNSYQENTLEEVINIEEVSV